MIFNGTKALNGIGIRFCFPLLLVYGSQDLISDLPVSLFSGDKAFGCTEEGNNVDGAKCDEGVL